MLLLSRNSFLLKAAVSTLHHTFRHSVRSIHSSAIVAIAMKRKSVAQSATATKRAKAATEHAAVTQPGIPLTTPLSKLLDTMHAHLDKVQPRKGNVVHWFRSDLRLQDNRALDAASQKAKEQGKYLIALYVVSPQVSLASVMRLSVGLEVS